MKIINLTNLETSEIKYEVSKFPDGQHQIKILGYEYFSPGNRREDSSITFYSISQRNLGDKIQIKSRLNNFKDLELIICTVASLRNLGVKEIHLYVPFFLGSRSDRQFEEGSNNYLKQVICPIINSLKLDSVTVLDPHSDVLEACLNNFKKKDNLNLVRFATNSYQHSNKKTSGVMSEDFILISPDAGANKKIFKIAEQIGYKGDIITCSKSRDENGKLSRVEIPINTSLIDKDMIIIDDICDGGATFLNIAKKLKEIYKGKIYLIVTHGIFSKGLTELNKYFDGIYTTDSYATISNPVFSLTKDDSFKKVHQLKVF